MSQTTTRVRGDAVTPSSTQTRWLKKAPERITGLYRFSILAKQPFTVDFGGVPITDVRSLEIYHEAPMFIDQLAGLGGVQVETAEQRINSIRLVPTRDGELSFRITAEEPVPELSTFASHKMVGKFKTPLPHRSAAGHLKHWGNAKLSDISHRLAAPDSVGDHVASAIAAPFIAAVAVAPALPNAFVTTGAAAAFCLLMAHSLQTAAVAAVSTDPSRTYVNGTLYKNLAAVNVRIGSGQIIGYTTP